MRTRRTRKGLHDALEREHMVEEFLLYRSKKSNQPGVSLRQCPSSTASSFSSLVSSLFRMFSFFKFLILLSVCSRQTHSQKIAPLRSPGHRSGNIVLSPGNFGRRWNWRLGCCLHSCDPRFREEQQKDCRRRRREPFGSHQTQLFLWF